MMTINTTRNGIIADDEGIVTNAAGHNNQSSDHVHFQNRFVERPITQFQVDHICLFGASHSNSGFRQAQSQNSQLQSSDLEFSSGSTSPLQQELAIRPVTQNTPPRQQLQVQDRHQPTVEFQIPYVGDEPFSHCLANFLPLKLQYQGPILSYKQDPYIWLNDNQSMAMLKSSQGGYQCAELVLAELRARQYMKTPCALPKAEILDIEKRAIASIRVQLAVFDHPVNIESDRIDNTGKRRFLQAILLNGKYCAVKLKSDPVIRGLWYSNSRTSAVLVDFEHNPHLGTHRKGRYWHVVDIEEWQFDSLLNYVVELPGDWEKANRF